MAERLQKVLSQWGITSRRQAEAMIQQGRITVNGKVAKLGQKADPAVDQIAVDDTLVGPDQRPDLYYLLLHKPLGMVSTCNDPEGRPTVLDAIAPDLRQVGIHPVGRLDAYSTGALILTNDGDFTYRLTHPKHNVSKTYQVWVDGIPDPSALQAWRQGLDLAGQITRPAQVKILKQSSGPKTLLKVMLWEGRNRQIRRVVQALGHRVLSLHRTAIGSVNLGQLLPGECRILSSQEVVALLTESISPDENQAVPFLKSVQSVRY